MKKIAFLAVCLLSLFAAQLQAAKGAPALELKGHMGEVQFIAFSPLGQRIVTVDDFYVRIWNARSGKLVRALVWCDDVALADALSTKRFVTFNDNTVQIWNTKTGKLVRTLQWCTHKDGIEFVALSPRGHRAVTVRADNSLQVWNARTGRTVRGINGHPGYIESAAVSPLGKRVVTVSRGTVLVWTLP
jgi:WD40 repeat protein